jgi:hypothetical protein
MEILPSEMTEDGKVAVGPLRMAAMITIRAEQAASHALRAASLPRTDPISVPDEPRIGQITAICPRISINKTCKLKR